MKPMQTALRLIVVLLLSLGSPSISYGEVSVSSFTSPINGNKVTMVTIKGVISSNVLRTLQRQINVKGRPYVQVFLTASPGGDWNASLALGRFLRKIEADVSVTGDCYSSCVLLLAAGLHRSVLEGNVGIHRPYSSDTTPKTFLEAQQRYRAIEAETRKYLLDMNMPEDLFEAMVRVPPESIRVLTDTELQQFGLSQNDPAAQEVDDANEAREYGLTKGEYLSRKARQEIICPNPGGVLMDHTISIPEAKRIEILESWYSCREDVMRGVR